MANTNHMETIVSNMCEFMWKQPAPEHTARFHQYMEDIIFERDAYDEDGRYIFTYEFEDIFPYIPCLYLLYSEEGALFKEDEIQAAFRSIYPKWRHDTINESMSTTPQELAQKIIIELNRYAIYYVGVMDEYIMERREHEDIIFSRRNRNFSEIWHKLPETLYDEFNELNFEQQEEVKLYIKDVYPDWRP